MISLVSPFDAIGIQRLLIEQQQKAFSVSEGIPIREKLSCDNMQYKLTKGNQDLLAYSQDNKLEF